MIIARYHTATGIEMEHRTSYECAACRAVSGVVVSDLSDPQTLISARSKETLEELQATRRKLGLRADDDPMASFGDSLLAELARHELLYATCPRCGTRNREGEAAIAKDHRLTRVIGGVTCAVLALGAIFVPTLASLVAVLVVLATLAIVVAYVRSDRATRQPGVLVLNLAIAAGVVAVAVYLPRWTAVLPLVVGLRYVTMRATGDAKWEAAKKKLRFDQPYR